MAAQRIEVKMSFLTGSMGKPWKSLMRKLVPLEDFLLLLSLLIHACRIWHILLWERMDFPGAPKYCCVPIIHRRGKGSVVPSLWTDVFFLCPGTSLRV